MLNRKRTVIRFCPEWFADVDGVLLGNRFVVAVPWVTNPQNYLALPAFITIGYFVCRVCAPS